MTQKIDSATWTGLDPDFGREDVRAAQRPVEGGPKPLEPKSYHERAIHWGNAFLAIPIWAAVVFISEKNAIDALWLILVFAGLFLVFSVFLTLWRSRPGRKATITLNADGLNMPYQYKDPIPWSKIGRIEPSYGRWIRWTTVMVDKDFNVVQLSPWPLRLLPEDKRALSMPAIIISSWTMAVDMEELVEELSRFRDNYCGE